MDKIRLDAPLFTSKKKIVIKLLGYDMDLDEPQQKSHCLFQQSICN